jgi:bacteriocin-like protein
MSRRSVSPLDGDEIMSKTKDTEKTRELTTDELEHVSGGSYFGPRIEWTYTKQK